MKKRCTNSACRKYFIADSVCPYCGKKYPRVHPANQKDRSRAQPMDEIDLVLMRWNKVMCGR